MRETDRSDAFTASGRTLVTDRDRAAIGRAVRSGASLAIVGRTYGLSADRVYAIAWGEDLARLRRAAIDRQPHDRRGGDRRKG